MRFLLRMLGRPQDVKNVKNKKRITRGGSQIAREVQSTHGARQLGDAQFGEVPVFDATVTVEGHPFLHWCRHVIVTSSSHHVIVTSSLTVAFRIAAIVFSGSGFSMSGFISTRSPMTLVSPPSILRRSWWM